MTTKFPNSASLLIHPEIAAISRDNEQPETAQARRDALRAKIAAEGVNRPIYVWPHDGQYFVLEGIDIFFIATELGLRPNENYVVEVIDLPTLEAAKQWRFERAATTQREVSDIKRCMETLKLYKNEIIEYRKKANANQSKGGKGESIESFEKLDLLSLLAAKAGVSRSSMARAKTIADEMNRDPNAEDETKRPQIPSDELLAIIADVENGQRSLKNAAEDVKNARERAIRKDKNSRGAKQASADFVCDADFDPNKLSQIICGDSLELMERWTALPLAERPQPTVIFGSPPYWIAQHEDDKKDDGKGRIHYGENFRAMMDRRGIKTFEQYVEGFLRPYIVAAYELLPRGGRLIIQIDNTRGRDADGNLRVYFHTHQVVRIAEEIGFIASSEIIWRKLEISGRKQGFGSRNSPSIRPNHEYIIVLRKDCNAIDGDFEYIGSAMNEMAISSWDEKPIEDWSEREKTLYTSGIWEIGAARSHIHPATFSRQLADWVIRMFAPDGSVVLDPWNGIGTTSVMATLCKRRFLGIEIEPYFCEVATERVSAAIKELPKLEAEADERLRQRAA